MNFGFHYSFWDIISNRQTEYTVFFDTKEELLDFADMIKRLIHNVEYTYFVRATRKEIEKYC